MEKSFTHNSIQLHAYAHKGKKRGKVYILLHGIFSTYKGTFEYLIPLLQARGHAVIAIDLLGHGRSSAYEHITLTDIVEYAFHYFDDEALISREQEIVIIGFSLGSIIGQRIAYKLQDAGYRVQYLVCVAGFFHIPPRLSRILFRLSLQATSKIPTRFFEQVKRSSAFKLLVKMLGFHGKMDAHTFEHHFETLEFASPERVGYLCKLFSNEQSAGIVKKNIHYGVINIRGEHDSLSSEKDFLMIAKQYGEKAISFIIPDCGHLVLLEKPDVVDVALQYLEEIPPLPFMPRTSPSPLSELKLRVQRFLKR